MVGFDAFPDGSNVAFRWSDGQRVAIDVGPGGLFPGRAIGVSYDGSVIVGRQGWNTGASEVFRWQSGVTSTLAAPGEPNQVSPFAQDVFDDGRIVVGSRAGGSWLWQGDTFISVDGSNAASDLSSSESRVVGAARATTADGFVVGPRVGFIWDVNSGIRLPTDFIQNELHLQLEGWSMADSFGYAISDDGTAIVGSGTNPDGVVESFILVIPEPTIALLMLIGLAGLGRRRSSAGRPRPTTPPTRPRRLPSGLVDQNGMSGVRRKSL